VHVLEHTTFLVFGVLFWAQVFGLSPAASRLPVTHRIGYVASSIVPNVALSMYLAFAQHPLYAPYAVLVHRPGGISARADQQIGAGIMWSAGDLPFAAAIAVLVQRWLTQTEAATARLASTWGPDTPAPTRGS
jgi:cytochrome c oxidase assembly factor CtaG